MIYERKCNICGEVLRVNGSINMEFKQHMHIRDIHPVSWTNRQSLCNAVSEARRQVQNFDNSIWGK